jgi:hypothetical protein
MTESTTEMNRNQRRDRKRTTKMVVDNGGVRKLKPQYRDAHPNYDVQRIAELTSWVRQLKSEPCVDCEHTFHPTAMQFDHVRGVKVLKVSDLVARGCSRAKILAEIAKCELVCANCHAVRTHERRNISGATLGL